MKQYFIAVTAILMLACSLKVKSQKMDEHKLSNDSMFVIKRGTNIAHWLSQSDKRGEERAQFFTKKDIDFIKSAGFDHIRLPVDEEQLWDSSEKREEEAFRLLNDCMTWVHDAGLRVVLDLHIIRSHYFNAQENPLWTKKEEQDKL